MFRLLYLISILMCAIRKYLLYSAVLDSAESEKTPIDIPSLFATLILLVWNIFTEV